MELLKRTWQLQISSSNKNPLKAAFGIIDDAVAYMIDKIIYFLTLVKILCSQNKGKQKEKYPREREKRLGTGGRRK